MACVRVLVWYVVTAGEDIFERGGIFFPWEKNSGNKQCRSADTKKLRLQDSSASTGLIPDKLTANASTTLHALRTGSPRQTIFGH